MSLVNWLKSKRSETGPQDKDNEEKGGLKVNLNKFPMLHSAVDECEPVDPPTSKIGGCTLDNEHSYSGKRKPNIVETVEHEKASSKSKPKAPRTRVYSPAWEKEYSGVLTYDGQQLYCSLCKAAKMKNSFASPTGASESLTVVCG